MNHSNARFQLRGKINGLEMQSFSEPSKFKKINKYISLNQIYVHNERH